MTDFVESPYFKLLFPNTNPEKNFMPVTICKTQKINGENINRLFRALIENITFIMQQMIMDNENGIAQSPSIKRIAPLAESRRICSLLMY
jgi:hypothetical protein